MTDTGQNQVLKHIIAVSSGKGGVGKSTVAANIAVALAQKGLKVGLMDADITGPNLPLIMGAEGQPAMEDEKIVPMGAHGVKLMSMGFLIDPHKPIIWRGPMIHHAIRQLFEDVWWGELDYMIVDLPPGTGDAQLTLAQLVPVTGVVIVTQPQQVSLGDALRGILMFEQVEVEIIGVIENMTGDLFGEGGGEHLAASQGVPYLGSIPLDPRVRVGGDTGVPIVASDPESPAGQAIAMLADDIIQRVDDLVAGQDDDIIQLNTVG